MLTALLQEPWCFHPEQVASLTDHQIIERYVLPAARRAEEREREVAESRAAPPPAASPGAKPVGPRPARGAAAEPEPGTPEHRAQVVGSFTSVMGMSPERAAALYERQLAEWRAQRGGG